MTREECKTVLKFMVASYATFRPENMKEMIDAWYLFLHDFDFDKIMDSLIVYVHTNDTGFAPSISQLISLTYQDADANDLTEADAWGFVRKAIGRSGNYELEEFDKLPETVQRAVGSASVLHAWAMDENFNESVVQSNFLKSYREELRKLRINRRIPKEDWKQILDMQMERKAIGG